MAERSTEANRQVDTDTLSITLSILVPLLGICAVLLFILLRRRLKGNSLEDLIPRLHPEQVINIDADRVMKLAANRIPFSSVNVQQSIGQGQFGEIYKGTLTSSGALHQVAIKKLHASHMDRDSVIGFLSESIFTDAFDHPHILKAMGICWQDTDGTPLIVLPYMIHGDLKSLIKLPHLELPLGMLLHFGRQVADAMVYLSERHFIHRDLAARNCLVGERYNVKLADFGMSRDIYVKAYYRLDTSKRRRLPVKWMALESLADGVYTTKSDVWSFGVLLWELCTRGSLPYADVDSVDTRKFIEKGNRLERPRMLSEELYRRLLWPCWLSDPDKRPTFSLLLTELQRVLLHFPPSLRSGYEYIDEELVQNSPTLSHRLRSSQSENSVLDSSSSINCEELDDSCSSSDTGLYVVTVCDTNDPESNSDPLDSTELEESYV